LNSIILNLIKFIQIYFNLIGLFINHPIRFLIVFIQVNYFLYLEFEVNQANFMIISNSFDY